MRLLLDRAAPSALLYVHVPDIAATVERLRARGATIDAEPHVIFTHSDNSLGPAGAREWQAFVQDSEGNVVGLVQWEPAIGTGRAADEPAPAR